MPEQLRVYTIWLSDTDILKVRQVKNGKNIVKFSVQSNAHINGTWHKITRYDNVHNQPHRHVYSPTNPECTLDMYTGDTNLAFTQAVGVTKKKFKDMRESYTIQSERNGESHD